MRSKKATEAPAKKSATKPARKSTGKSASFSAEERAAMKERKAELKAEAARADGEKAVLDQIGAMPKSERAMAERLHAIVRDAAPTLTPKTWYGMPAYARDGKVVCFLQAASKFKTRYATLGFSDEAKLDDGAMWPASFALTTIGPAEEKRIRELLRRALGA